MGEIMRKQIDRAHGIGVAPKYSDFADTVGDQYDRFSEPAARAQGRHDAIEKGGYMDAIPIAATSGIAGNLPDYGPAIVEGVKAKASGGDFSKAYTDSLEYQRGQREGLAQKFPKTSIAGNIGGAMLTGAKAASKFVTAPTLVGRVAQRTALGAGLGAAQGAASGEGVEGRVQEAKRGGKIGAVLGGVGEAVLSPFGSLLGKMFGGGKAKPGDLAPADRVAGAKDFGIPLSRGQATGNVGQQAFEQAAANGTRGTPAQSVLRTFTDRQGQAIEEATKKFGSDLGGHASTPGQAGDTIAQALKDRAEGLRSDATDAYGRAAGKEAFVSADAVAGLGHSIKQRLEEGGINLDAYGNYPGSHAAINLLGRVSGFAGAPAGGKVVAQSLQGLEQARKGLLQVKPGNAEDYRALKAIRSSFDDWMTNAVDQKLFSGDPTALDDLRNARNLWLQYKGQTTGGPGATDASKLIAKISTEDRTGDEVANWLLGTSTVGQAGRAGRVAAQLKNTLGDGSPEWQALRQAAWSKVVNPPKGNSPKNVADALEEFTGKTGAPLSHVLFSPDEYNRMRAFATVLRSTSPPPAKNGYELASLMAGKYGVMAAAGAVAGGAAYETGDPRYLALAALPLLRNVASASKGFAATRAAPLAVGQAIRGAGRGVTIGGAGAYEGNRQHPGAAYPAAQRQP
jgi:hypothetical protein